MAILEAVKHSRLFGRFRRSHSPSAPRSPQERKRDYERDGFVLGGPLLNRALIARARKDFDEIFERRTEPHSGIEHEHRDDGGGGEFFKVYNLHRLSPAFHEIVPHPRLAALLGEITGCDRLRVLLDQIQYKPPVSGGWNGLHRDMPSFPFIPPYTALTACIPLDDATTENGCLRMVPGSHSWGDASDLAGDDWGIGRNPGTYHGHEVKEVACPMRAGEVEFHHGLTWHCTAPNPTSGPRRALAILLFNADAKYREGGRTVFPELSEGDSMETIAPLVIDTGLGPAS